MLCQEAFFQVLYGMPQDFSLCLTFFFLISPKAFLKKLDADDN